MKNPRFKGPRYYLVLAASVLGVFGLFLLGASQMYFRISSLQGRLLIFAVFLGWLLVLIVGFGWMEVWERFKDPYKFLARYCAAIQTLFLMLILNSTITDGGRSIALYELALHSPSNSYWIYCYIFASSILYVIYLTPIGRNRRLAKISGILAPSNVILISAIMLHFNDRWDTFGWAILILVLFLSCVGTFPQMYWAFNPGKGRLNKPCQEDIRNPMHPSDSG